MEYVARYILKAFQADAAVEVGVGRRDAAARALVDAGVSVTATDVRDVRDGLDEVVARGFVEDDVRDPDVDVYTGAEVVYSVRPPYGIHASIDRVARRVGAGVVIAPLADEGTPLEVDRGAGLAREGADLGLVNHEGRPLYVRGGATDRSLRGR